jgi:hypothetical protein
MSGKLLEKAPELGIAGEALRQRAILLDVERSGDQLDPANDVVESGQRAGSRQAVSVWFHKVVDMR